jgi:nucleoid-associated protein YgaU
MKKKIKKVKGRSGISRAHKSSVKNRNRLLFLTLFVLMMGCATGDINSADSSDSAESAAVAKKNTQSSGSLAEEKVQESPKVETLAAANTSLEQPVAKAAPEATPTPEPTAESSPEPTPATNAIHAPESSPSPAVMAESAPKSSSEAITASLSPQSSLSPSEGAAGAELSPELETYKIQKNDTLMKIAFKVYNDPFDWAAIFELNKDILHDPNLIPSGVTIKYKPLSNVKPKKKQGHKYVIRTGDTLSKIAQSVYGNANKWQFIWKQNDDVIHDPEKIMAGLVIYYTGGHLQTVAKTVKAPEPESDESNVTQEETQASAPQLAEPEVNPEKSMQSKKMPDIQPGLLHFSSVGQPKTKELDAVSGPGSIQEVQARAAAVSPSAEPAQESAAPVNQAAGTVSQAPAPKGDTSAPLTEEDPIPAH